MNFFLKYKKIMLIAGFIVITILLGYLLYLLFFKSAPSVITDPSTDTTKSTSTGAGFPISGQGGGIAAKPGAESGENIGRLIPVKASPVAQGGLTETRDLGNNNNSNATLSGDGDEVQYYDRDDGKFYRINKEGDITVLSGNKFFDVDKVTWSTDKNRAILEYPDGANIIYNFSTDKQITLPKHWEDFSFSPTGDNIILKSIGLDPNNRWLVIADKNGSGARIIESLGENADTVYPAWSPNNQTIGMYSRGIGFDRQEIFFIGQNQENFKSTTIEGRGFEPLWSPEGNRLLYSAYSSQNNLKPRLWIVNAEGKSIGSARKNLQVDTWAHKCIFKNNEEVYCAVPENLEEGAGLFPELAQQTKDRLYKINTVTGAKKLMAIPERTYNMSNLIISSNGYYLYFTDEKTGQISQIKLK